MYRHSRIARAAEFAQAVAVARMLTTEYAALTKGIPAVMNHEWRERAETLWRTIWEQLTVARAVARQSGRAVAPFQYTRQTLMVRAYGWHVAPYSQPRAAIAALMAAVPDVDIPPAPSSVVPNVRIELPWFAIPVMSAFALLAALVVLRY